MFMYLSISFLSSQKLQLKFEDIVIRGLKWSKLLDPGKKGQWWLSGNSASNADNVEEVANIIDGEVLEAQQMLQLAVEQRMNTDARKGIFCVVMGSEDYIDAFEKLLRLDLPGKQVSISAFFFYPSFSRLFYSFSY